MSLRMVSILVLFLGVGCQEPRTSTSVPESRPRILIQQAPQGSVVFVDGKEVGQAKDYNGNPGVLLMEAGTHLVEVRLGDQVLISQRVFLGGGELRTISIQK